MNRASSYFYYIRIICFSVFLFAITGCKKENSVQTSTPEDLATSDAASSISGAVSVNNGGLLDQMRDFLNTPTSVGLLFKTSVLFPTDTLASIKSTYDPTTGWWTDSVSRSKSGMLWSSRYSRVYKHQFVNKNGVFQQKYITGSDTAYTIHHEIVSGSGSMNNPWMSHTLKSLSAKWTGTGTNTDFITINSTEPYTRMATDTITNKNSMRTLDATLTVNFVNVVGPKGSGLNWYKKVSGNITGHYHALVTFQKGETYGEKTIDRDFSLTMGDTLKLHVGGKTFYPDIETGYCGN